MADRSDNYSSYVGRVTQAFTTACPIAVGEVVWRIKDELTGTPPQTYGMTTYSPPAAQASAYGCWTESEVTRFLMPSKDVLQIRRRDAVDGPYSDIYEARRLSGGPAGGDEAAEGTDTSPPVVTALGRVRPQYYGSKPILPYRVEDDSGKARVHVVLYSGGVPDARGDTVVFAPAKGKDTFAKMKREPKAANVGPFYYCLWAEDKAGNRSVGWPNSSCAWLPIEVDLTVKDVANGCGSDIWNTGPIQHVILNTRTWGNIEVSFKPACDVHDAGYGGLAIEDPFTGKLVDFRDQTRLQIDERFLRDLQTLCRKALSKAPPADLQDCLTSEKWGAVAYFNGVRKLAQGAFDSDVTAPNKDGIVQTQVPAFTNPPGGGRSNA
ncbi:MAG: hypothetical protein Q7V58_06910 [Actinomycetota bacterium]|nr:hypothetical protein [Actinomycetota bacterium]